LFLIQLKALALTLSIESFFFFIFYRLFNFTLVQGLKSSLSVVIAASLITHPLCWFFILDLDLGMSFNQRVLVAELLVFMGESLIFKHFLKTNWKTAILLSLGCNLASYLIGILVM